MPWRGVPCRSGDGRAASVPLGRRAGVPGRRPATTVEFRDRAQAMTAWRSFVLPLRDDRGVPWRRSGDDRATFCAA